MIILITENKVEIVKNLIKSQGITYAVQVIGGFENLAKVFGYESVPEYVKQYLTENFYPDYGWESHEFYRDEVEKYGDHQFYISDMISFDYTKHSNHTHTLEIYPWLYNKLDEIFEVDYEDIFNWKSIFKQWFTDNTGLKVDRVI